MPKPQTGTTAVTAATQPVGVAAVGVSPTLVSAHNAAVQSIPLLPGRVDELPVELNQFLAATHGNRSRLDFDIEPARFVVALCRPGKNND